MSKDSPYSKPKQEKYAPDSQTYGVCECFFYTGLIS